MSTNKTDAWMPLWVGDYLADTQHLDTREHGAYFLLMMAYWRNQGPLADDDKRLASITKCNLKDWKLVRPTLSELFQVGSGVWSHKRIEQELGSSKERSERAASKAKAAAQARWGHSTSDAPSIPQAPKEDAPSIPQAVQEECPSPSPSPSPIGTPTLVAKEDIELNTHNDACVLKPGAVCKAMKAQGIGDVNPGNADLLMLIDAGTTLAEFEGAATTATGKAKGFVYALGIVKRSRQEAAATAQTLHQGAMPGAQKPQQKTFAERDREAGWARWEEQTGKTHPDRTKAEQSSGRIIDITPRFMEIAQ